MSFPFPAAFAAMFAAVAATSSPPSQPVQQVAQQQVPLIAPAALQTLMKSGVRLYILDVRTPAEFAEGHIEGAVLMPLDNLSSTYTQIPKTVKLVVYCRSGHRSAQAVTFLLAHGYDRAISLAGGYMAWTAAR
jgi:phage shock protein E